MATPDLLAILGGAGAFVGGGAAAFAVIWKRFGNGKNGHSSNGSREKALEQVTAALGVVSTNVATQTSVLQAVGLNLATLNERVAHVSTKDDLREFTEKNRHAAAAVGDKAVHAVRDEIGALCDAADLRDKNIHTRLDVLPDQVAAKVRDR